MAARWNRTTALGGTARRIARRLLGRPGAPADQPINRPLLYPGWEGLVPPRALWVNAEDSFTHFLRWVFEYRAYLTLLCQLRRDESVLELGCNHGRTMLGLVDYLRPPGRYEGLDILPRQVAFAQQRIRAANPVCNFTLADVHNGLYNPHGRIRAEEFRFPYEDASFDLVFAASLFTHLLPAASANYFKEARRVLRPGGRCLFSFLLLDDYDRRGPSAWYEFPHRLDDVPGVRVYDVENPERIIAYDSSVVRTLATDAGLRLARIVPGFWSDPHVLGVNEHDLVLLEAN